MQNTGGTSRNHSISSLSNTQRIFSLVPVRISKVTHSISNRVDTILGKEKKHFYSSYDDVVTKLGIKNFDYYNPSYDSLQHILQEAKKYPEILEFPEIIRALQLEISKNYPAISILAKLQPGVKVESMIFGGVKKLNDLTSDQAFTDKILFLFKKKVQEKYPTFEPIWNDYKNFVGTKYIKNNDLQLLLDEVFEEVKKSETSVDIQRRISKCKNPLQVVSNAMTIKGKNQEDIMYDLAKLRITLERAYSGNETTLENIQELEHNLVNTYVEYTSESEHVSTDIIQLKSGEEHTTYNIFTIESGVLIKKTIIAEKTYTERIPIFDKEFIFEDGKKNIEYSLSIDIITLVKKGKLPESHPLFQDIKVLLDSYVANAEFIPPFWMKGENHEIVSQEVLDLYNNLGKKTDLNQLNMLLQTTYKGGISRGKLLELVEKDKGTLMFIDIKNMGSMNMQNISRKVNQYLNDIQEPNISTHKKTRLHKKMLFESGIDMTHDFIRLVDKIEGLKSTYPDLQFYIGGDEIILYTKKKKNGSKMAKEMTIILNSLLMGARISYRDAIKGGSIHPGEGEKLISSLDEVTRYSKIIEERLNSVIKMVKYKKESGEIDQEKFEKLFKIYNSLKDFSISIRGDKIFVHFIHNPIKTGSLIPFAGINFIRLEDIIDTDIEKLYAESVFTQFLDLKELGKKGI